MTAPAMTRAEREDVLKVARAREAEEDQDPIND